MAEDVMSKVAQALTIAGSDSGGGAGIQADLKTFQMRGVFGTSVITAVTAQNTLGVFDIHAIPLQTIQSQLKAIADDFTISAFKIGMLGTAEIIECIAEALNQYHFGTLVLDPVMIAKGGAPLLQQRAVDSLNKFLLPLADVITPNLPEAKALTGVEVIDDQTAQQAAKILQARGVKTVVIKGGHSAHSQSAVCCDWVFTPDAQFTLESPRYATAQTHGTGCTFSACMTAELAKGASVEQAIKTAKDYGCESIAFPLLATGTYGFPKDIGVDVAVSAFTEFLEEYEMEITLVVFESEAVSISGKLVEEVRSFIDDRLVEEALVEEYAEDRLYRRERRFGAETASLVPVNEGVKDVKGLYTSKIPYMAEEKPLASCVPQVSLEDALKNIYTDSFEKYLQKLINKKGLKNSEIYAAANISKQYFSKLLKGQVKPSKEKMLALAVGLRLNMDETVDFLRIAGYALSPISQTDTVVEYFIRKQEYNVLKIDIVLFDYGLEPLSNI